eukprot:scaffold182215_cov50-Cyclotella_meneghiniana.AAC.1
MAPATRSKAPTAKAPSAPSTRRRGVSVSGPTRNVPSRQSKRNLVERGFSKRHNPPDSPNKSELKPATEAASPEIQEKPNKNSAPNPPPEEASTYDTGSGTLLAVSEAARSPSKLDANDEMVAFSPSPKKQSFASPIPHKSEKYLDEMGSPKAEAIFASFQGSIKDASDVSSDDESLCLDEVDEDLLNKDDLAADEPGPSSPQLRTLSRSKSTPAASPISVSTTESSLEGWEAELRDDSGHLTYIYEPLEACELCDFARVKSTNGNGNCGVEAMIKGLRRSFSRQLRYDSNLQEELLDTFRGHNYFRFQLRQYIEHNYIEFLTCSDPIFIDKYGQPDGIMKIKLDPKGNVSKTFIANGKACSNIDLIMDRIHQSEYFDSLGSSKSVDEEHWIDFKVTLPWAAKKYEQSFICYNPNGKRNGKRVRMTHVYFYRPDGKVQSFAYVGYRPPFPGAICITYNGNDHYDALEIKSGCALSEAPHFPSDNSEDIQRNVPALPSMTEAQGYELKQPPEILYNLHRDDTIREANVVNQSHDSIPVRNVATTPQKDDIANREPKEKYKYWKPPTSSGGRTFVNYRNEKKLEIKLTRDQFEQLASVHPHPDSVNTQTTMPELYPISSLEWKDSSNNRYHIGNTLHDFLVNGDEFFKGHYEPRFGQGNLIVARLDYKKLAKKKPNAKQRKTRAEHSLVMYKKLTCSHY